MTTGVVIFSRLDSQRLPGKALKPFAGRALIGHVIDRALRAKTADAVIVATSDRPVDDPIADFVAAQGAALFRGDAEDVLGRAAACAKAFGLKEMIRICGDSPFIDPLLLDQAVQIHREETPDLTTNLSPRTFPAGMSLEVIDAGALERVEALTGEKDDREHVTTYFYRHPDDFSIRNIDTEDGGYEEFPLTVDTAEDLVQANWIACHLADKKGDYGMDEVLELARQWRKLNPVNKDKRKVS